MDAVQHGGTKAPPYDKIRRLVGSPFALQNFIDPVEATIGRPRAFKERPYEGKTEESSGYPLNEKITDIL